MDNQQVAANKVIELYNRMLETPLDEAQEEVVSHFLLGQGDEASLSSLPLVPYPLPGRSPSTYDAEKALDNVDAKHGKRVPQYLATFKLLHRVNAVSLCFSFLYGHLDRDKNRGNYDIYFGEGGLGHLVEMEYRLSRLDNSHLDRGIEAAHKKLEELEEKYPGDIEKLAETGKPVTRLRACSCLYAGNPEKYGPILDEVLQGYAKTFSARALIAACAHSGFAHKELRNALKAKWSEDLRWFVRSCEAMKYHCPQFLDEEIYSKVATYDDHTLGECLFFARLGEAVEMEEEQVLLGLYEHYDTLKNADHLAAFFSRYPREVVINVFHKTTQYKEGESYWRGDFTLRLWRLIFIGMGWDTAPVCDKLAKFYNEIVLGMVKYAYESDEYKGEKVPEARRREIRAQTEKDLGLFLTGQDDDALERIVGDDDASGCVVDQTNGSFYGMHQLLGYFCDEPRLERPMKLVTAYSTWCRLRYSNIRVIPILQAAGWAFDKVIDYFLAWSQPAMRLVEFYDDFLLTDKEMGDKKSHLFTPEVVANILPRAKEYILAHEKETLEYLNTRTSTQAGFGILKVYYKDNPKADPTPLLRLLTMKDKMLRARVLECIPHYPALRPALEAMLEGSKKDVRAAVEKALAAVNKINVFPVAGSGQGQAVDKNFDLAAFAAKNCPDLEKALPFTNIAQWPVVHKAANEEVVPTDIIACYVGMYATAKDAERLYLAEQMRPYFNKDDMRQLAGVVYKDWRAKEAEAKHKGVLALYGIHGGDVAVKELKNAVNEFVLNSRSAMAAASVQGMAASLSTMALVGVDNLSRTHRNKQVRRVAGETIAASAAALGLTQEQMSDKIVPTLGLDERGELHLTTGTEHVAGRQFKALLLLNLTVQLYNEEGEQLKKFPVYKYGLDDHSQHEEAAVDFAVLKKEVKSIVTMQTKRLNSSLRDAREWTTQDYNELFIQNPIMQRFASSLIFGVYKEGSLVESFRYAGDGSFSNIQDKEFILPVDACIQLVHPMDMTEEQRTQWQQQLDDYEITQPLPQLQRPMFEPGEVSTKTYEGFVNTWIPGSAANKLFQQGWFRGGEGDGGGYYCIFYNHAPTGISACLKFTGDCLSAGGEYGESTGLGEIVFFATGAVVPNYDLRMNESDILPVKQLPRRMFSELIYGVTLVKPQQEKYEDE